MTLAIAPKLNVKLYEPEIASSTIHSSSTLHGVS